MLLPIAGKKGKETAKANVRLGATKGNGDPGRIRTCDLQLRRLLLYPLSYGATRPPTYTESCAAARG